jgi:hypothetical protein
VWEIVPLNLWSLLIPANMDSETSLKEKPFLTIGTLKWFLEEIRTWLRAFVTEWSHDLELQHTLMLQELDPSSKDMRAEST